MSANYHAKVQSIDENIITFQLVLADDSFASFADLEFALRLLCSPDNTYKYDADYNQVANCPLAEEISLDNYLDENWIDNNSYQFIEDVKLISLNNFPFDDWDYDRWSNDITIDRDDIPDFNGMEPDHPGGVVAIKVFNPKHLQHFTPGMAFSTTAYSILNMEQSHYDNIGNWIYSE